MVFLILHQFSFFWALLEFSSQKSNKAHFTFLLVPIFVSVVAVSYDLGMDYFAYQSVFDSVISIDEIGGFGELDRNFSYIHGEYGFLFLNSLVKFFFDSHNAVYLFSSLISMSCVVVALSKFSESVNFGFYLYVSFFFLSFNLVQIRLGVASSLLLYSVVFLLERRWFGYLLSVVLASLFHKLAMVGLLFVFLAYIPYRLGSLILIVLGFLMFSFKPLSYVQSLNATLGLDFFGWHQLNHYMGVEEYSGNDFPVTAFIARGILLLSIIYVYSKSGVKDKATEVGVLIITLGMFFWLAFWELSILAGRLNNILFLLFIMVVPRIVALSGGGRARLLVLIVILYSFYSFYSKLLNLENNFFNYRSILF